mmetsp:Transcript_1357/g.4082  ORF Transcript_1357/g.4082 Transcript_1357/m.4082 type:complete len:261 (-) Transcript_1357:633-1415(-)
MALIGVRSSCDILAKNLLFANADDSATALACSIAIAAFFSFVRSYPRITTTLPLPKPSKIVAEAENHTFCLTPLALVLGEEIQPQQSGPPPFSTAARTANSKLSELFFNPSSLFLQQSSKSEFPIVSCIFNPVKLSQPGFTIRIRKSASVRTSTSHVDLLLGASKLLFLNVEDSIDDSNASAVAKPEGTDAMSGSRSLLLLRCARVSDGVRSSSTADNPDKSCPEAGCEVIVALFSLVLNAWFVFCPGSALSCDLTYRDK